MGFGFFGGDVHGTLALALDQQHLHEHHEGPQVDPIAPALFSLISEKEAARLFDLCFFFSRRFFGRGDLGVADTKRHISSFKVECALPPRVANSSLPHQVFSRALAASSLTCSFFTLHTSHTWTPYLPMLSLNTPPQSHLPAQTILHLLGSCPPPETRHGTSSWRHTLTKSTSPPLPSLLLPSSSPISSPCHVAASHLEKAASHSTTFTKVTSAESLQRNSLHHPARTPPRPSCPRSPCQTVAWDRRLFAPRKRRPSNLLLSWNRLRDGTKLTKSKVHALPWISTHVDAGPGSI